MHRIFATNPSTFDALRHQIDAHQSVTKIIEHGSWCVTLNPMAFVSYLCSTALVQEQMSCQVTCQRLSSSWLESWNWSGPNIFVLIPTKNYQLKIQTQIPEFELGFWRGIDSTHGIFLTSPSTFNALCHQIDVHQSVMKIGVHWA